MTVFSTLFTLKHTYITQYTQVCSKDILEAQRLTISSASAFNEPLLQTFKASPAFSVNYNTVYLKIACI